MEPSIILLILRILSAIFLLGFMGSLGWLLWQSLDYSNVNQANTDAAGHLVMISAEDMTKLPLQPVTVIGRSPTCAITITDTYASSEHALLTLRGNNWWLEDMRSRNGTLLNKIPVTEPTIVSGGDIIAIGDTRFKLELA